MIPVDERDPDISSITAYTGKIRGTINRRLINSMDAARLLNLMPGLKNKMILPKMAIAKGAKRFTPRFTGGEAISFTDRVLAVYEGKREIEIVPSKFRQTYYAESMKPGFNPLDMPFPAFIWNAVIEELAAELNDNTVWNGLGPDDVVQFSASATYAAGDIVVWGPSSNQENDYLVLSSTTAGQTPVTHPGKFREINNLTIFKGFGTLIKELLVLGSNNGGLGAVSTGAITPEDILDQVKEQYMAHTEAQRNRGVYIYMQTDLAEMYSEAYYDKYEKYVQTPQGTGNLILPFTGGKGQIVPSSFMSGSNRFMSGPKEAFCLGTDAINDLSNVHTETDHYTVEGSMTYAMGVQIGDLESVRVNDQV